MGLGLAGALQPRICSAAVRGRSTSTPPLSCSPTSSRWTSVFFRHLVSDDGSVRHTGDNLVGGVGQGGDDEAILVDLQRVPVHIDQIVFTVNSFTGQTFAEMQNAFCRTRRRDQRPGAGPLHPDRRRRVHRADHGEGAAPGSGWSMTAIGTPANGRTFQDLMPAILPSL